MSWLFTRDTRVLRRWLKPRVAVVFAFSLLSSFPSAAESSALIVYPQVKEPYSAIFSEMVEGFKTSFIGKSSAIAIGESGQKQFVDKMHESEPDLIVALSNMTFQVVAAAQNNTPVLVGAVTAVPEFRVSGGVSMMPGAAIYLEELLSIYPGARRVFFVFDPDHDAGLKKESLEFLTGRELAGIATPAREIRAAALAYKKFLESASAGDVIWVYPNSKLINSSLLSEILDIAWRKRLVVFSSNPSHVKRGALFALYPDNVGIGARLGELANSLVEGETSSIGIESLRNVRLAVNARTSDHLGLNFPDEVKQKIDLILPGR